MRGSLAWPRGIYEAKHKGIEKLIGAFSIREFCDVKMPIFMFDKDDRFMVMLLEEVRPSISFGPRLSPPPC